MTLTEKIIDSVHKTTGLRCFEGEPKGDIFGRFAYFVTLQSSNRFGEVAIFFVERPVYNRLSPTRATEDCAQLAIRWLNGLYAYSGLKFQDIISQNSVRDGKGGYGIGIRLVLANTTSTNFGGKIDFVELALSCSPLGAAQLSGAKKYMKGKTATAGATEKHGFTFTKWTDGTSDVSTDNPYSFTINDDTSLVAVLSRNNYTLSLSGDTGVDSTTGAGTYPYEQSVTATATAKHGFAFTNWTSGGTVVSTDNPYTFNLLDNTSLVANTGRANYTVSLSEATQGSITTFTGAGSYPYEQNVTVGATVAYGFTFSKWTDGTTDVSTDNPYTFELLDDTSLVSVVTRNNYTLSLSGGTGVTSTTGGGTYPYEQSVTATAVLDSHYDFSNWTSGGTVVSSSNPYQFNLLADTTLQANATPKSYNVLGVSNDPTLGSVSGGGTYTYGSTVTLTATPVGSNVFENWTVNGTVVSSSNPYVLTATEAVIVQGNFAVPVQYYSVTTAVNDATMGSASGGGSYQSGATCTLTATPNSGYQFVEWQVNGSQVSTSDTYSFTVSDDVTVTAVFEAASVTPDYLKFTANTDGSTIKIAKNGNPPTISLEVSDNGKTWMTYNVGDTIILTNAGHYVMFRGNNQTFSSGINNNYYRFSMTGSIAASGKITSLYDSTFQSLTIPATYFFVNLFQGCTSLTTAPELPATTLAASCYWQMFKGCTSLTSAPELPATALTTNCYKYMFQGCTSLTTAPELPATALGQYCYGGMFDGCTSLTHAPELPATSLTQECYNQMFQGCTSLTTAPELPATTLVGLCYSSMFQGCTSLTTAPELPATTLAASCYWQMFYGCTSLTTAPELPASTLAVNCYNAMFYGCTSLNYIKCLATNISSSGCTGNWVSNVSATGTFVKDASMNDWTTGNNGIPSGWTIQNAS